MNNGKKVTEKEVTGQMPESTSMGRKLAEAHVNMGKILFHTGVRVALAGVVVFAGIRGNPPKGAPASLIAGLVAALIALLALGWVFFPLVHWGDHLTFYEAGIIVGRQPWALEKLGEISFMDVKNNYSLFGQTYMCTQARRFNVTYIKDAKKNYNRAYFKGI